ncbi:MAG: hypothetical protein HYS16_00420 [Deltaproteobacteria bacterium]|nr:MAG: hypothetical protein HYS16_00420 [Deltaproteobacteria bacterium]
MIDISEIEKLFLLSKISIGRDELVSYSATLDDMLEYMENLKRIKADNEEMVSVLSLNEFCLNSRNEYDHLGDFGLKCSKQYLDGFIRADKVFDHDER